MKNTDFETRDLFIHFRDLVLYILLRWRSILLVALAGAVLMGGVRFWLDTQRYNAAVAAQDDAATELVTELTPEGAARVALVQGYQKAYDSICAYNKEAPLMKIDFTAAPTRRIAYLVTGENSVAAAALCRQVLTAEDLYAELSQQQSAAWPAYLAELATVETECDPSDAPGWALLTVEIVSPDEGLCGQLTDLLRREVERVMTSANGASGKWMTDVYSVRYSERVYLRQMDSLQQQKQLQTELNAATAALTAADREFLFTADHEDEPDWSYPTPAVNPGYVALGFAGGAAVMALWYALRYLFCGRVLSEADLAVRQGVTVFGSLAGTEKRCAVDRWMCRRLQDKDTDPELLARQVALAAEESGMTAVYWMGDLPEIFAHELEENSIQVIAGNNPADCLIGMSQLPMADGLVLAVQSGVTNHADLARALAIAKTLDRPVLGAILQK